MAAPRHRVLVSTDIGGTDPDDVQSLVHILLYSDVLEIEGLVSSPYGAGRKSDILAVIDHYETDHPSLRTWSGTYPTPEALRSLTKQGETDRAPHAGFRDATEGSSWIVRCARRDDARPLHVLVWGGLEDLAQALHDAPDILPRVRVYWIGGPNKKWSPDAYQFIVREFPSLWIIESNATYRGWFHDRDDDNDDEEWSNDGFVARHVAGHGALGDSFAELLGGTLKMGDSPSVGWLLQGDPTDPTSPGWGGRYVRAPRRPFVDFSRLPSRDDRMETFGILELAIPLGDGLPADAEARLEVENQSLPGHVADDGAVRFRFSPKAAKEYRFILRSNVPGLDGREGGITALAPRDGPRPTPSPDLPNWWTDDPAIDRAHGEHIGARTVSRWRQDYLRDFAARLDRCARPAPRDG